jgi:uncharacterized protein (TIGR01777 family)
MSRVLITGGSGFLGRAVTARFLRAGWSVAVLSRDPASMRARLPESVEIFSWDDLRRDRIHGIDAVVHLAGASIAGGLWTKARKRKLRQSRGETAHALVASLHRIGGRRNGVGALAFVSASGMGYYGDRGADPVAVADAPGVDFLGQLAADWERATFAARESEARVVIVRLGMVLGNGGGALGPLRTSTRLGLGAVLGDGKQYWPWIHLEDAADLFFQSVVNPSLHGIVHGVAGDPVTQREFAKTLAKVSRRPLWLRVPASLLRAGLGEMADLFLHGQRAEPDPRFALWHGSLEGALRELFSPANPGGTAVNPNAGETGKERKLPV